MLREIPERCSFLPGEYIDREYQVKKLLGEGSFGMVYDVCDRQDRHFALKILPLWKREAHLREELVNRFQLEFETGRIRSDYIVYSYHSDWVKGNPYIVMELCSETSLQRFMKNPDTDVEKVVCEILYGLRDLHRNGKVHRDLKPANILRKKTGTFALSDFGTSGNCRVKPERRGIFSKIQTFGTLAYMSPEQINPKKAISTVLPTTDIFSFGVVLYEMLFHQYPFGDLEKETDIDNYIKKVKAGKWNETVFHLHNCPEYWYEILDGCLQPNFQKRIQTVDGILSLIPCHLQGNVGSVARQASNPARKVTTNCLLRIVYGSESGRTISLRSFADAGKYVVTIGREHSGFSNDVELKDTDASYISRRHCTLEYDVAGRKWHLRDGQWYGGEWHNSLNGTFVNTAELHDAESDRILSEGDILSIGEVKLRVETE